MSSGASQTDPFDPDSASLDPEDTAEFFLAFLPFLALPNPYGRLALPRPRQLARHAADVARTPHEVAAHATVEPARAGQTVETAPAPAPAPEDDDDLTPSPWDPGFDPPPGALGRRPQAQGPDPRSLSLNRKRPSGVMQAVRPASQTAAPPPPSKPKPQSVEAAWDILILPQNPHFKAADQGVTAVLTYLRTAQMFTARARHDNPDGVVFDLTPEVFVHMIFVQGQAPPGAPAVREATLRVWPKPQPQTFGPAGKQACFALELIGCRYPQVLEAFKARLHQIVYLRPEVHVVPHDPARLRVAEPAPAQPIPAFDMQEVDRS
ncbi:MAG: hypothetical protein U1F43_08945 [Myxococcota bacterium]